jgi:hypothetical protein
MAVVTIFDRYPQLATLKGLVPDDVVERQIGARADEFEGLLASAKKRIPTVRLCDLFPPELERGTITLTNFLGHWGNVSIEEVCKLALIARWLQPRRVLEIGTYNGMTTLQIALNVPSDAVVYTLDLPPDMQAALPLSDLDNYVAHHFRQRFGTQTGSYFAGRTDVHIRQLLGDSATFDYASAIDGPLDLVFIDAAHDYPNKKIDSERALELLSPHGVVIWHNYADVTCPDVTKYLGELSARLPIRHLRNTMLAVYRRE